MYYALRLILDGIDKDSGYFGPVWAGYDNNPEGAVEKLIEEQHGEIPHAFHHPEIGWIGFIYGNSRLGLMHIAEKRGWSFVRRLPGLLRNGRVVRQPGVKKIHIVDESKPASVAVVRMEWNGQEKAWIVTAYRDDKGRF